jgi:hypothetical protein
MPTTAIARCSSRATSSTLNGFEQFGLSVAQGQTYYIKVSGSNLLQKNPSYNLSVRPAAVQFDWTMNKRIGKSTGQAGFERAFDFDNSGTVNNADFANSATATANRSPTSKPPPPSSRYSGERAGERGRER